MRAISPTSRPDAYRAQGRSYRGCLTPRRDLFAPEGIFCRSALARDQPHTEARPISRPRALLQGRPHTEARPISRPKGSFVGARLRAISLTLRPDPYRAQGRSYRGIPTPRPDAYRAQGRSYRGGLTSRPDLSQERACAQSALPDCQGPPATYPIPSPSFANPAEAVGRRQVPVREHVFLPLRMLVGIFLQARKQIPTARRDVFRLCRVAAGSHDGAVRRIVQTSPWHPVRRPTPGAILRRPAVAISGVQGVRFLAFNTL